MKKYEELAKEMQVPKSLRKVRKPKDKPGEGVQVSIKNFLQKVQEVEKEGGIVSKASLESKGLKTFSPEKTLKPLNPRSSGAQTKPGLGKKTSRPTSGPPTKVGGKVAGGGRKEGIRSLGPLEKWLLPLGKTTGPSGTAGHGQGE